MCPHRAAARFGRRLARGARAWGLRLAEELHGMGSRWPGRRAGGRLHAAAAPDPSRLSLLLSRAEQVLADNILPFWARHAPDAEHGGFITHLGRTGDRLGATDKYLVMQARLTWTFAAAHRHGLAGDGYLELAEHGRRFLIEQMWDHTHGGFVWAVTRDGSARDDRKSVYGQAFAIYALAECGLAMRRPDAVAWAERAVDLLVTRAAAGRSGFGEAFARDWTPAAGSTASLKMLNTHLHVMEALIPLVEASRRAQDVALLRQLVEVLAARAIHPRHRYVWDEFDREWRPHRTWPQRSRISYGHGVELAWLLFDAVDRLGEPRGRIREAALGVIDHALAFGFDAGRGGLAAYGPPLGAVERAFYLPASRLIKQWWQQAELLVAVLEAYRESGRAAYLAAFAKQFEWIWRHQIDHQGGEWFESTTWRDGHPLGDIKGHDWKDPYHNARAMMETVRRLRTLDVRPLRGDERRA